jgi:hypothetical protein
MERDYKNGYIVSSFFNYMKIIPPCQYKCPPPHGRRQEALLRKTISNIAARSGKIRTFVAGCSEAMRTGRAGGLERPVPGDHASPVAAWGAAPAAGWASGLESGGIKDALATGGKKGAER